MNRKKVISLSGWLISILSAVYFFYYVKNNYSTIPTVDLDHNKIFFLMLLSLVYLLGFVIASVSWKILLRQHHIQIPFSCALSVYAKAQFAKYLPGNIGHHVGRVVLARQLEIPAYITVQTILLETAWLISIGATLASVYIYMLTSEVNIQHYAGINFNILLAIAVATLLLPLVSIRLTNSFFPKLIARATGLSALKEPTLTASIKILSLQLTSFVIVGFVIDMLAIVIFDANQSRLVYLICVYAFSWVAGTIVPGAPAGIGIREALLVSALTPIYGAGTSINISVTLRIITTCGDIAGFLLGLLLCRHHTK